MAGYPARGNPILGLVHRPDGQDGQMDDPHLANDGKPYTTLGYHNGPGAVTEGRQELSEDTPLQHNYRQQALVPLNSETHGGEDVAIYATGAGSQLISGVMEQNVIYHIMHHALRERLDH